jgi:hypothetical protein
MCTFAILLYESITYKLMHVINHKSLLQGNKQHLYTKILVSRDTTCMYPTQQHDRRD